MAIERSAARMMASANRNVRPWIGPYVEPSIFGGERRLRLVRGAEGSVHR
jgi:hypothetical protein